MEGLVEMGQEDVGESGGGGVGQMGSRLTLVFRSCLITPALRADSKPEHSSVLSFWDHLGVREEIWKGWHNLSTSFLLVEA